MPATALAKLKSFFGFDNSAAFVAEWKELTQDDKDELLVLIEQV